MNQATITAIKGHLDQLKKGISILEQALAEYVPATKPVTPNGALDNALLQQQAAPLVNNANVTAGCEQFASGKETAPGAASAEPTPAKPACACPSGTTQQP
jgi:hypothetical protein